MSAGAAAGERDYLLSAMSWLLARYLNAPSRPSGSRLEVEAVEWLLASAGLLPDGKDHRNKVAFAALSRQVYKDLLERDLAFERAEQRKAERLLVQVMGLTRTLLSHEEGPKSDTDWPRTLSNREGVACLRFYASRPTSVLDADSLAMLARLMLNHARALRRLGERDRAQRLETAVDTRFRRRPAADLVAVDAQTLQRLRSIGPMGRELATLLVALDTYRTRFDPRRIEDIVRKAWIRAAAHDTAIDGAFLDALLEFAMRVAVARAAQRLGFEIKSYHETGRPFLLGLEHREWQLELEIADHHRLPKGVRDSAVDPYPVYADHIGLAVKAKQPDLVIRMARPPDVARPFWMLGDAKRYTTSSDGEVLRTVTLYQSAFAELLGIRRSGWPLVADVPRMPSGYIRPHFVLFLLQQSKNLATSTTPGATASRDALLALADFAGVPLEQWQVGGVSRYVGEVPPIVSFCVQEGLVERDGVAERMLCGVLLALVWQSFADGQGCLSSACQ